jgi:hypothetical protein
LPTANAKHSDESLNHQKTEATSIIDNYNGSSDVLNNIHNKKAWQVLENATTSVGFKYDRM